MKDIKGHISKQASPQKNEQQVNYSIENKENCLVEKDTNLEWSDLVIMLYLWN